MANKPRKPVLDVDAEPHNANWIRLLGQQQPKPKKPKKQPKRTQ